MKAGLSPGAHTERLCTLRDSTAAKRKAQSVTKKAKIRRLELKAMR